VRRIEIRQGRFTLRLLCSADDLDALKKQPQTRGAPLVEPPNNWDEEKYGEDASSAISPMRSTTIYAPARS